MESRTKVTPVHVSLATAAPHQRLRRRSKEAVGVPEGRADKLQARKPQALRPRGTRTQPLPEAPSKSKQLTAVLFSPLGGLFSLCVLTFSWGVLTTFAAPPLGANSGSSSSDCDGPDFQSLLVCICPRETICVYNVKDMVFLACARLSAYFDYPLYVLLFVSKAHNLRGVLARSFLSELLPLNDLHGLHTLAGAVVGVEVVWHSFWHLLRWGLAGDISLLWTHVTGRSGLVALLLTPLIVWPMLFRGLRKRMRYEVRKALHYLSIVWGIALCFHAPQRHIAIVMGIAVGVYVLDYLYGFFFAIHHLPTLRFTRIGKAVEVTWENPPGFVSSGSGYVYLCLPWISRAEWHAFSIMMHPTKPNHSCVCMATLGDWTTKVHAALAKPTCRPGWVYGPFASPFSSGGDFDNLIAIATGIGITPALSAVTALGENRRVNLIWMCRDPDLIEFYLAKTEFEPDAWTFIFYTGKRKLVLGTKVGIDSAAINPFVKVIHGRPDLEELTCSIVDNLTNGTSMPEELMARARKTDLETRGQSAADRFCNALERALLTYSLDELYELAYDATTRSEQDHAKHLYEPPAGVSLRGFTEMVRAVLNLEDGSTSDAEIASHFHAVDTSGDGALDREEFSATVTLLRGRGQGTDAALRPDDLRSRGQSTDAALRLDEESAEVPREDAELRTRQSVSDMPLEERRKLLACWQIMYCGGSAPVVSKLKQINSRYGVSLKLESFDW